MSDLRKGSMRLHAACVPDLPAGKYGINLQQTVFKAGEINQEVEEESQYIEVTGPRLSLAATEILGAFPPNHSVGAFDNRLAHITLKRRTLPWERNVGDADDGKPNRKPWLALVLLAEHEANFMRNVSIEEFNSSLTEEQQKALNLDTSGTMDLLEVTEDTVKKSFPLRDELPYLAHVREVNLTDTELAAGDDDGFMAVILSNRLPRKNHSYGAYLISLEERLDVLAETSEATDHCSPPNYNIGDACLYDNLSEALLMAASASYAQHHQTNPSADKEYADVANAAMAKNKTAFIATKNTSAYRGSHTAAHSDHTAGKGWAAATQTNQTNHQASETIAQIEPVAQPLLFHDMVFAAIPSLAAVKRVKFPVLAHWSFTCTDTGGFETLMQNIDIGLYGKVGEQNQAVDADLFTPGKVAMTDTGHTQVDHLTRQGEQTRSWYRGPLSPRQVVRNLQNTPYHTADQARRLVEDGREDISEAAAFECGRLLALSDTAFTQSLAEWRRRDFYLKRKKQIWEQWKKILPDTIVSDQFDHFDRFNPKLFERILHLDLLDRIIGNNPLTAPDRLVPVHDTLSGLGKEDIPEFAEGLGLGINEVEDVLIDPSGQLTTPLQDVTLPAGQDFDHLIKEVDTEFSHLQSGLRQTLGEIVQEIDSSIDIDKDLDHLLDGSLDQFNFDVDKPGGLDMDKVTLPSDLESKVIELEKGIQDKLGKVIDRINEIDKGFPGQKGRISR